MNKSFHKRETTEKMKRSYTFPMMKEEINQLINLRKICKNI